MVRNKRCSLAVAVLTLVGGLFLAMPAQSDAAPAPHSVQVTSAAAHVVVPLEARGCSGNACIWLGTPSGGKVTVHGCAWKTTIYGHITLSGPAPQLPQNSVSGTWHATSHYCTGGDQFMSRTVNATVGQYCATVWQAGNYDGTACESVK